MRDEGGTPFATSPARGTVAAARSCGSSPAGQRPLPPRRVKLRPSTQGDRDLLLRVYASTRAEELAPLPWPQEVKARLRAAAVRRAGRVLPRALPDGDVRRVVDDAGQAAGRLYVERWPAEIRIVDIAVLPEARGRGLGSALLRGLIAESEAAGKPLTIHVERQNRALAWYERLGCRRTGTRASTCSWSARLELRRRSPRRSSIGVAPDRDDEDLERAELSFSSGQICCARTGSAGPRKVTVNGERLPAPSVAAASGSWVCASVSSSSVRGRPCRP